MLSALLISAAIHASAAGAILDMESGSTDADKDMEKVSFRVEDFVIEKGKKAESKQPAPENLIAAKEEKRVVTVKKSVAEKKSAVEKPVKKVSSEELPFALSGLAKGEGVETPSAEQDLVAGNPDIAVEKEVEYEVIQQSAAPPAVEKQKKVAIVLPVPKKISKGKYPKGAQSSGVVEVKLKLLINSAGLVANIKIVKGSGIDLFDNEAMELVRTYEFHPAERNGSAIEYSIPWTVRFIPE
ncbi:MAG: TonB family protein [Deltaproteobacteria bacterium]|nr:TonB family protein [Deltaproteobacteria bacterium]